MSPFSKPLYAYFIPETQRKEFAMPIKTTPGELIFVTEGRVNLKANGFKE